MRETESSGSDDPCPASDSDKVVKCIELHTGLMDNMIYENNMGRNKNKGVQWG